MPWLLALVAALMLAMANVPARAHGVTHDSCPPDCPMVAHAEGGAAAAHHPGHASDQGSNAGPSCEQGVLCQAAPVPAMLAAQPGLIAAWSGASAALRPLDQLPAVSHPPDPGLRPPIQL